MSRFSRGSGDVIDLPEMQRRGLIKFPEPEEIIDEIDFTASPSKEDEDTDYSKKETSTNSGVTDFLSDFASIGASNQPQEINGTEYTNRENYGTSDSLKLVNDLKWRLENTEYKMEQLMERLTALEKKSSM
ncbi:MAG: hypothetical protein ACP5NS_00650 [Candidatus Pacearchaeota archaeon]